MALAAGGTLVIASAGERADPVLLARRAAAAGVTAASVVPSLLAVLDPAAVPGLRRVVSGAEALTGPLAAAVEPGPADWSTPTGRPRRR